MASAPTSGKRDVMMTLVIVTLLTLVGAGVGFSVGAMLGEAGDPQAAVAPGDAAAESQTAGSKDAEKQTQVPDEEAEREAQATGELKIVPFPPVLTTLADPKGKWIRLEGSILIDTESGKAPELLAEEAGEQILAYLRSVRLDQLDSASGILGLKDDLDETLTTLSGGQVRRVLIHGLVVE
jgi:flagellar FliL protein